ncbi:MAG: DUF4199 domain-containing protein [Myxococcota bacterium]
MRTILLFGVASGATVIAWAVAAPLFGDELAYSEWLGYLVMLLGLSLVFVGVKRYRDREKGGVIAFGPAFLVGLGISAVAAVVYTVVWEIQLHLTDFAFVEAYTEALIAAEREKGVDAARLAEFERNLAEDMASYTNPLFRLPITFLEIFPIGVLVSLASAGLLRYPKKADAKS